MLSEAKPVESVRFRKERVRQRAKKEGKKEEREKEKRAE